MHECAAADRATPQNGPSFYADGGIPTPARIDFVGRYTLGRGVRSDMNVDRISGM
jgi:hypothetical protein